MDSPNCDGSRSYESTYSRNGQYPRDREVHHNAAYDSTLDCEELQSVGVESKEKGLRRKDNDLYEPTGPLKQRVRQVTEYSDDLSALSVCSSSGLPSWKKDSCLSILILFLIIAFSVAALVLVILIIYGTLGPKCGCKGFNTDLARDPDQFASNADSPYIPGKRHKDGEVSNDDLQTLGKAIGVKWDRLARRLPEIKEDDIEEIEDSHRTLSHRGFHMLKLWKTNNGEAADYKTLHDALVHYMVQWKDLAEKYCFE